MGEQGLLCVGIPEAYGGFESDFLFSSVIAEELSRANVAALATNTTVHSDIVAHYVLNAGTEEQKLKYLPKMVSGEIVGAIAMTEPGCGSDLQGVRATAKLDGDDYVINGSKTFITNGQHCGFVIVVARTKMDVSGAKGTSLFIVDCDSAGFSRGRNLDKIGLHSGDTSEMFFEDVRVPKTALLGPLNGGFGVLMGELQRERLTLAVNAVAAAEGALQYAIDYAKERTAFGGPISKLQNTKFRLAEMATEVRVHKAFIEECKVSYMVNQLDVASASMAKLSCTEMQGRIVDGCLQIFGGYGYMLSLIHI